MGLGHGTPNPLYHKSRYDEDHIVNRGDMKAAKPLRDKLGDVDKPVAPLSSDAERYPDL